MGPEAEGMQSFRRAEMRIYGFSPHPDAEPPFEWHFGRPVIGRRKEPPEEGGFSVAHFGPGVPPWGLRRLRQPVMLGFVVVAEVLGPLCRPPLENRRVLLVRHYEGLASHSLKEKTNSAFCCRRFSCVVLPNAEPRGAAIR